MSSSKARRYVQRDLEDQIEEEKQSKNVNNEFINQFYQFNQSLKNTSMSTAQALPKKQVSISEVLSLLKAGYARYTKSEKGYPESGDGKSIQSHYGITQTQVQEIFANPKLKGRKMKNADLEIIDDAPDAPVYNAAPKKKAVSGESTAKKAAAPVSAATDTALFD